MDVRGLLAVGLGDDLVDEADDRGLLPQLAEVNLREVAVHLEVEAAVLHHLLDGVGPDAVVLARRLADLLARAERQAHGAAHGQAQAVGHAGIEGVGGGHGQHAVGEAHRHHAILEDSPRRQPLDGVALRLPARQRGELHAEQRREPLQEIGLAAAGHADHGRDQPPLHRGGGLERLPHLLLREQARAGQDRR